MAEHTPTPWIHSDPIDVDKDRLWILGPKRQEPGRALVAREVTVPDASLILRAVNAHAELVAALQSAATVYAGMAGGEPPGVWNWAMLEREAREVLAKVKDATRTDG